MASSYTPPQPGPGEVKPFASVPFEVVRQAEFVFEPFMGSLIQLPEARVQRAQSSEFFLAPSPLRVVTTPSSVDAEAGEAVVWGRSQPLPQPSASAALTSAELHPATNIEAETEKIAKEPELPGFYQPQMVRFFDPLAASIEVGEGADASELPGPRASAHLSPELKAAILRIDEQRRQMLREEKPAKKKRGFPKARPGKAGDVREAPIEIVKPQHVNLTERVVRWEEISAPRPVADDPVSDVKPAMTESKAADARPTAEIEQMAAMIAAVTAEPTMAPRATVVPTSEVESNAEVVPSHQFASTHDATQIPAPVPSTPAAEWQESIASAMQEEEIVAMLEEATGPAVEPTSITPVFEEAAMSPLETAPVEDGSSPPMIFAADAAMREPVEEEPEAPTPESSSTRRLRGLAASISRLKRADLVSEPVASAIPQSSSVEEQEEQEAPSRKERLTLAMRLQRWLGGEAPKLDGNRRRAERTIMPGLVAFYWSGGTPKPHEIVNISKTGFYVKTTTDFWTVETLVRMTLQRPHSETSRKGESISVLARVVRIDEGGVGHEFVTTEALLHARSMDVMPSHGTDWRELDKFLHMQ